MYVLNSPKLIHESGWLNLMVNVRLILKETSKLSSKVGGIFQIPIIIEGQFPIFSKDNAERFFLGQIDITYVFFSEVPFTSFPIFIKFFFIDKF